jgi:transcriptional regulator with XRE-family HTH domain
LIPVTLCDTITRQRTFKYICNEPGDSVPAAGIGEDIALHFGNWLKTRRAHLGISLEELAERSKRSKNYLSVIERNAPHYRTGTLPNPSNAVFEDIARGLGLPGLEVRDAWARLGNGNQEDAETSLPESEPEFEHLKALYSDMEEADREEMMAYAQFRVLRRNPQSAFLPSGFPSSACEADAGGTCLRVEVETGSVYTCEGKRVTDREELLEIAAMIKAQVTQLEIEASQGGKAP